VSKLLRLKEWVTISDAARYLSESLSEPVSEADLFKWALDERLVLSIYLPNGLWAHRYEEVPETELAPDTRTASEEWRRPQDLQGRPVIWFQGKFLRLCEYKGLGAAYILEASTVDLPMIGTERDEIEEEFQKRFGGPELAFRYAGHANVLSARGDLFLAKQGARKADPLDTSLSDREREHRFKAVPIERLSEVGTFVVRPAELARFLAEVGEQDRPTKATSAAADTRKRRTLLTVIAALCRKAGIDYAGRGAAGAIRAATEELGAPVGEDVLRSMLGEIPDALETRQV
jgi:hypothetical protein